MTKIRIFLASSLDMREERLALGNYIRKLNDIYMERGVYFQLFMCEDEDLSMADTRKQDEYDRQVRDSQLCLVLFFNKAGQYTVEEFEAAYDQFQKTGAPSVVTFFRRGDGYAPEKSLLDFLHRLDLELQHYFKVYEHIDSLKLSLLMQIKLMNLDVPIEFRGGRAFIGNTEVLTLENLPILMKNENFMRLKTECEKLEREFLDAKAHYLADPTDDTAFLSASTCWNRAKESLSEMESSLFDLLLTAEEQGAKGTLTPRQRKALALLEQGDARAANEIMDTKAILEDAAHEEEMAGKLRQQLELRVQELLQKIDILETFRENPDRFAEIREIYECAVELEDRNHLTRNALKRYVAFLRKQTDYSQCAVMAERYRDCMEREGSEDELALALHYCGRVYRMLDRFEESESAYLRALEIRRRLAEDGSAEHLKHLADTLHNLGMLYRNLSRYNEAEQYFLESKEIDEQQYAEDPEGHEADLATTYSNIAVLYETMRRYPEAEEYYRRSIAIRKKLADAEPETYRSAYASICHSYGSFLGDQGRFNDAETLLLRAKSIRRALSRENPEANLPSYASTCSALGSFYRNAGLYERAEAEYKTAREIRESLAAQEPEVYLVTLANICSRLGRLYNALKRFPEAETEYSHAKTIYEQLAAVHPDAYLYDLAILCNNFGVMLENCKRYAEAECLYLRAREIYEQLVSEYPEIYTESLERTMRNLRDLYRAIGNSEAADAIDRELEERKRSRQLDKLKSYLNYKKD